MRSAFNQCYKKENMVACLFAQQMPLAKTQNNINKYNTMIKKKLLEIPLSFCSNKK